MRISAPSMEAAPVMSSSTPSLMGLPAAAPEAAVLPLGLAAGDADAAADGLAAGFDAGALAAGGGIEDVGSDETLVREADVFLSVLPPSEAPALAKRIAGAVRQAGAELLYADCNAISPGTVEKVARLTEGTGIRFVDVGIIGNPPLPGPPKTRLYASGPHAGEFAQLGQHGLDVRVMGDRIGQASGIKMCYASLTKGLTALGTELLTAS